MPSGGRVFHDPGRDTAGHGDVAGHVGVAGAVGDCPDRHAGPDGDVRPAQVAVGVVAQHEVADGGLVGTGPHVADDVGAAIGIGGHPVHAHGVFGLVGALPQQEAVRVEFPREDDAGGVVADRVDVVEAVDIHHLAGEVVGRRPDDLRGGGRGLRARGVPGASSKTESSKPNGAD